MQMVRCVARSALRSRHRSAARDGKHFAEVVKDCGGFDSQVRSKSGQISLTLGRGWPTSADSCPHSVESGPDVPTMANIHVESRPRSGEIKSKHRSKLGKERGPNSTEAGRSRRNWSSSAQSWPRIGQELARFRQMVDGIRPTSARVHQAWPDVGRSWAAGVRRTFARVRPDMGRLNQVSYPKMHPQQRNVSARV